MLKQLISYLNATGFNNFRVCLPPILITASISFLEVFNLGLIYPILQFLVDKEGFKDNFLMSYVLQVAPSLTHNSLSLILIILFVSLTLFRGAFSYYGHKCIFNKIAINESKFAAEKFEGLLAKDYLYFVNTPSLQIVRDIAIAIPQGYSTSLQSIFLMSSEVLILTCMGIILLITDAMFFLTFVGLFGFAGLIYLKFMNPRIIALGASRHNNSHKCIGIIQQSIEGIQQIKNSAAEKYFSNLFQGARNTQALITSQFNLFQIFPKIFFETIMGLCIGSFLIYNIIFVNYKIETTLVTLGFYTISALRLLPSILRLSVQYNNLMSYKDSIKVVIALGSRKEKIIFRDIKTNSFKDAIRLENICFKYNKHWVLKDLCLELKKNKCIGIIGKSGEGKTTLVNILAGLLPPDQGQLYVDSHKISFNDVNEKLGSMISYVPQNIYLIDGTLSENVGFGKEAEEIDLKKVIEVLKLANLKDFEERVTKGELVSVGERGIKISGGQRQRIGIARALYFNRDIIIFDEATSALDEETEAKICETIKSLKGKKTIIMITHRKNPLAVCDEIFELKNGQLSMRPANG